MEYHVFLVAATEGSASFGRGYQKHTSCIIRVIFVRSAVYTWSEVVD